MTLAEHSIHLTALFARNLLCFCKLTVLPVTTTSVARGGRGEKTQNFTAVCRELGLLVKDTEHIKLT